MTFLEGCMSDISPAYLRAELGSVVQYLDDTLGDWIELRGVLVVRCAALAARRDARAGVLASQT